jgi:hypothetical protein
VDTTKNIIEFKEFQECRATCHSYDKRLVVLEIEVDALKKDVRDHKVLTEQTNNILEEIKLEIASAKGFLRALVMGGSLFVVVCTGLVAAKWLQIPAPVQQITSGPIINPTK